MNLHRDKFENWYKICIVGTDNPNFILEFNDEVGLYVDTKVNILWYTWSSAIQLTVLDYDREQNCNTNFDATPGSVHLG